MNRKQGKGTLSFPNGDKYEGEFENDKMQGRGTITFSTGDVYEGEMADNQMHGVGNIRYANGNTYKGDFEAGFLHGVGVFFTASDQSVYDGTFQYNHRSREGVMAWMNGEQYDGEWLNNERSGFGAFYWINGNSYEGEWKGGKLHGEGIYTWAMPGSSGGRKIQGVSVASGISGQPGSNDQQGGNILSTQKIQLVMAPNLKLDPLQHAQIMKSISESGFLSEMFIQQNNANVGAMSKNECNYCQSGVEFPVDFSRDFMFSTSPMHTTNSHSASERMMKIIRDKKKSVKKEEVDEEEGFVKPADKLV
eukprot:gene26437-33015_t